MTKIFMMRVSLDITGVDHTIWVSGSSFSVREVTRDEYEDTTVDGA